MRIFLSWSGEQSKAIANALKDWLPLVIQSVKPWMSAADIDIGSRWSSEVAGELAACQVGIICLTPENQRAPWIHFEAGALSKTIEKTYVCPYLYGLRPADLEGPFVQFQACIADRDDTQRLTRTVNKALGESALRESVLDQTFDTFWPKLEASLNDIPAQPLSPPPRPDREILEEILGIVRSLARSEDPQAKLPEWLSSVYYTGPRKHLLDVLVPNWNSCDRRLQLGLSDDSVSTGLNRLELLAKPRPAKPPEEPQQS